MPPTPDNLLKELRDLRRRISVLEKAPRLLNSAVTDPVTNKPLFYIGWLDGTQEYGVVLSRNDGSPALAIYGAAAEGAQQFLAIFDRQGNIVAGDDTNSGQGLARPYLNVPFASLDMSAASGTTSATFTSVETSQSYKTHPRFYGLALVIADAATTGDVRLRDTDGNNIGTQQAVAAGSFAYYAFGPDTVPGAHMATKQVELQVRRNSGAGVVRGRMVAGMWMQS